MMVLGRRELVGALLLFGALAPASTALAQDTGHMQDVPDFSDVTSKAAANKLVRQGRLVKIHAFPSELGGPDYKHNFVYVPPAVEEARQLLIGTLKRFTEEDLIDKLDVEAEYKGTSIIPARLRYVATHSRGGKPFEAVVEVW
jgi:hypothetical protein